MFVEKCGFALYIAPRGVWLRWLAQVSRMATVYPAPTLHAGWIYGWGFGCRSAALCRPAFGPPIMISKIGRTESYRLSDESEESIDEDGRRHEAQ